VGVSQGPDFGPVTFWIEEFFQGYIILY